MKITKGTDEIDRLKKLRDKANLGCVDGCPICGYKSDILGIIRMCKTWCESSGFLGRKSKHMRIDCYHCTMCGGEWESESYEYV